MYGLRHDRQTRRREQARLLSSVDRWKNLIEVLVARWSYTTFAGCAANKRGTNRFFPQYMFCVLGWMV